MRSFLLFVMTFLMSFCSLAQFRDGADDEKRPFQENLFTGGSVSFSFFGNTFLVGGSPVLGYSLTNWLDAGVVVNATYASYRDYNGVLNDKLRQTLFGGGGSARLYPVRFLFVQGQIERNSIQQTFIPVAGVKEKISVGASSTLIGGGYTSGRQGRGGRPFYYLAVMFDVGGDINSPYTDAYGRTIPIVRGGLQIPLFQGNSSR
jgi:hypothetical protein